MWLFIGWFILAVVLWALAGAPEIAGVDPLAWAPLPDGLEQPEYLAPAVVVALVCVGVILALGPTRRIAVHAGTVVHECGHGLTAAALGGVIHRITLARDGSGVATTGLPPRARLRGTLVSLAGYLAPGVLGLASLQMALAGLGVAWLGFLTVVAVVMLVLSMRSWWGAFVASVSALLGWLAVAYAPAAIATGIAAVLGGLLLARGVADAATQYRVLRSGHGRTDAANLSRQTGLPAGFFAFLHQSATLAMAGAGVWLLLAPTTWVAVG